jgi:outer membrane protein TolC
MGGDRGRPLAPQRTVLAALAQVADTLRALAHDAELLAAEAESLSAAEGALSLLEDNFRAGTASYVQVLVADGQVQQARIGWVQAKAQRLQDTVALFVALGGGWPAESTDRSKDPKAQR